MRFELRPLQYAFHARCGGWLGHWDTWRKQSSCTGTPLGHRCGTRLGHHDKCS